MVGTSGYMVGCWKIVSLQSSLDFGVRSFELDWTSTGLLLDDLARREVILIKVFTYVSNFLADLPCYNDP